MSSGPNCCRECYERYTYRGSGGNGICRRELEYMIEREVSRAIQTQGYRGAYYSSSMTQRSSVDQVADQTVNGMKLIKGEENMDIVEKVKNLRLTADEKLLRKHSVLDSDGNLTEEGQEVLLQILLDENKSKVVEAIKKVDAEEKSKK